MAHDIDDDGCRRKREANVDTYRLYIERRTNQICRPSGYFFGCLFGACPKPSNINRILGGGFFLNRFPIFRSAFLVCISPIIDKMDAYRSFDEPCCICFEMPTRPMSQKENESFFLSQNVSIVRSIRLASIKLFSFKYFFPIYNNNFQEVFFFSQKFYRDILKLFFSAKILQNEK